MSDFSCVYLFKYIVDLGAFFAQVDLGAFFHCINFGLVYAAIETQYFC